MNKIVITTRNELEEIIQNSVKEVLRTEIKNSANQGESFLDISEAAALLKLAKQTIYSLTATEQIPFFKRGKKLYFKKSELESWVSEGKKSIYNLK